MDISEALLIAIGIIIALILLVLIKEAVVRLLNYFFPGRKKTIFSHRKNQYKNRIGKKSKAYKKTNK